MKIRVDLDTCYRHFLWDEEFLKVVDPNGYYKTIEVSDEFMAKYYAWQKLDNEMQDELERIHNESFRTHYKTATT